jgi:hypothetical protein
MHTSVAANSSGAFSVTFAPTTAGSATGNLVCGGGSSSTQNPNGTPADASALVVIAKAGSTMQTQNLTRTVEPAEGGQGGEARIAKSFKIRTSERIAGSTVN